MIVNIVVPVVRAVFDHRAFLHVGGEANLARDALVERIVVDRRITERRPQVRLNVGDPVGTGGVNQRI